MRSRHVFVVYLVHNIHVRSPLLWSSATTESHGRLLDRISGMDAMVTLTRRQRDDIARRCGRTTNLFVVSHPATVPASAGAPPRDPDLVAVVARLEKQKRLTAAIDAFALVREQVPTARLDIYGDGGQRAALQRRIERLHLTDAVTLRGHEPHAQDALWSASAFLVTSYFEGWNLAMQESLSHRCPVVSSERPPASRSFAAPSMSSGTGSTCCARSSPSGRTGHGSTTSRWTSSRCACSLAASHRDCGRAHRRCRRRSPTPRTGSGCGSC
jgi:glycosyltransferase involved in cell wall biosynthesis